MTVATFVVAVLALLVSGTALGWNILNYLLTGQRAELNVTSMRVINRGMGQEMEPFVQITVRATGRVPVELTAWSLAFPGDIHFHSALIEEQYGHLSNVYLGDKLPKLIQPGSSGSFNLPKVAVEAIEKVHQLDLRKGHVQVYFAARKQLRDKKSIAERLGPGRKLLKI
jgi:hypothetical protein